MEKIVASGSVQVSIEKSSYDLALIYAQAKLQIRLNEKNKLEEDEIIFHLQNDFCYSLNLMTAVEEETFLSMLTDENRPLD